MTSSEGLVLVLFGGIPLPHGLGMFFRTGASFWTHCKLLVEPLSAVFLTGLPPLSLSLYDS